MRNLIFLKWQFNLLLGTIIISFCLAFDYLYKGYPKEVIVSMIQIFGLLNIFFSKKIKKEIEEYDRREKITNEALFSAIQAGVDRYESHESMTEVIDE